MMELPGYVICEQIHENNRISVYRGYASDSHMPVILKVLKKEEADPVGISRFMYEYEMVSNMNIEGVVKLLGMEQSASCFALVMEDVGGVSLRKYMEDHPVIDIQQFIEIAIQLTKIISRLHQKGIIHRDIKPENILIRPEPLQVYLIDFSSAILTKNKKNLVSDSPVGSLEYMSPEQTGQLNVPTDHRSDFYSIGVVFYELLTNTLPLQANNPAEWIYAHLAQRPQPPTALNPDIPHVISDIVMKLLRKAAESRYQSGYGLLQDIQECRSQLLQNGEIAFFPVGRFDISPSLQFPQEMYGREKEKNILESIFMSLAQGGSQTVFLSGYPGIGKTMVINEGLRPLVLGKGRFIAGKSDQLVKDIPYAPFSTAFGNLIRQLMTKSQKELEQWKEKILLAVGRNGSVVTEIVPELEWLIGKQAPAPELPPKEAESRFLMVFKQFIKVFASKTQPLVIFLDDLQWADPASIYLLRYLVQDANIDHLMFVGAFRENEVDKVHPLAKVLEAVKEQPNIMHISLKPLKIADVEKMLTELFNTEIKNVADLSADLYRKSGGNPFFLRQLLVYLKEEGFLYFDANGACWRWQMEAIQKLQPGDDVINLILKRLKKLPRDTYEIIKIASCIGNRFDLQTLSAICGKSEEETASSLMQLVHEGLLMQVEKTNEPSKPVKGEQFIFEFLHDKVQQAVYSPIEEDEKKEKHMAIGRLLFKKASRSYLEEKILTIMEHFNRSLEVISDPKERIELANYNLIAGRKAKASAAYQSALKYFLAGKKLLGDDAWEKFYRLSYDLHLELAQMEYFLGNEKIAEELFDIVIEKAPNELERASVYGLKVILYGGIGKYSDAVHTGIQALEKLGVKIPIQPTKIDYIKELLLYKWLMRGKEIEDLANLPEMNDLKKRKIAELLSRLSSVTMLSYPDLYSFIILKTGNYAAQNGNTEITSVGYLGYAITSGIIFGDYESGERYGKVSIQLVEKYDRSASKCIIYFVVGGLVAHWTQHAALGLEYLRKAVSAGVEAGDLLIIGFSHCLLLENRYLLGTSLNEIAEDCREKREIAIRLKHDNLAINAAIYEKLTTILRERKADALMTGIAELEKDEWLQLVRKDQASFATYYLHKIQLCYMVGDFKGALSAVREIEPLLGAILGFLCSAEYNFYHSLTIAAFCQEISHKERKRFLKILEKNQKQMKKWAGCCKENFEHKYLLVAAEIERLKGKKLEAISLYDSAILSAKENGYIQNEALANERAAEFYLSQGLEKIAKTYMQDAYGCYCKWGAFAKALFLKERYPQLLEEKRIEAQENDPPVEVLENISRIATPDESEIAASLDKYFIDETIDSISENTDLNKLFENFLDIATKRIGADKGCLVLEKDGELFIEAMKESSSAETVIKTVALEECDHVSKAIIRFVARTLEAVVLHHHSETGIFASDPYIAESDPKSIACLPLLFQGTPFGVLYLENSFIPEAFTSERFESLKLLSMQIAYIKSLQSYLKKYDGSEEQAGDESQELLVDALTNRELEVMNLIAEGLSNKEIAESLHMTVNTVKSHIKNIYGKLQVNRRVQAVEKAKKLGII